MRFTGEIHVSNVNEFISVCRSLKHSVILFYTHDLALSNIVPVGKASPSHFGDTVEYCIALGLSSNMKPKLILWRLGEKTAREYELSRFDVEPLLSSKFLHASLASRFSSVINESLGRWFKSEG